MTTSVALLGQYPHLWLLFTDGQSDIIDRGISVADAAQVYCRKMGVPPERVLFERAACTTYENAVFSAAVPGVDKTQSWLLLTSGYHMWRAMALFRAAGWNATPYSVGFLPSSRTPWTDYSLTRDAVRWQLVLHEVLGLAALAALGLADI